MFPDRIGVALACTAALTLTAPAQADAPATTGPFTINGPNGPVAAFEMGAAEGPGYPSLVGNSGDLRGWRNVQGGDNQDPNLDLGAGSTQRPGAVSVNYDIGKALRVYDGRKRLIARFDRTGTHFYGPVHFHRRARR